MLPAPFQTLEGVEMKKSKFLLMCVVVVLYAATAISTSAQSLTTLLTFNKTNGADPGTLTFGSNGNLYGAAGEDGEYLGGSIFELSTAGRTLGEYYFNGFDPGGGEFPNNPLVQAANGEFYGTTGGGGTGGTGGGTVFKVQNGQVITLYNFCSKPACADGTYPYFGLILGSNGNFYGTTNQGGTTCKLTDNGCGTVFVITPQGTLTTLYEFCSLPSCADGIFPVGPLVQGRDGNFYGTTMLGGTGCSGSGCGTIFKITPTGELTALHQFCSVPGCADGRFPYAGLMQASDGDFYGTADQGGIIKGCPVNTYGCGTIFKITPSGKFTKIYTFCTLENCTDGGGPSAPLMQDANGNIYGTAGFGGANNYGDIFEITTAGQFTVLYSFCAEQNCADGTTPASQLLERDGILYGTTSGYGNQTGGTVFSLSLE
jgi:uncharacterized repeat protein (TIGR03803 family)